MERLVERLMSWSFMGPMLILFGFLLVVYLVSLARAKIAQKEKSANDLLSRMRDVHGRGGISDTEFKRIKSMLAKRLRKELEASRAKSEHSKEEKIDRPWS